MTRQRYLSCAAVSEFVAWAADYSVIWPKRHHVRCSRNSPAMDFHIEGIEEAHRLYRWHSQWTHPDTGNRHRSTDGASTEAALAEMAAGLQTSLAVGDSERHRLFAHAVLDWGGVPVSKRFYDALHGQGRLIDYHRRLHAGDTAALDPDRADDDRLDRVEDMSSGITKVHCLLSKGRLPIYDTRFGAALAELVARWCVVRGRCQVPEELLLGCAMAKGHQRRAPQGPGRQRYPRLFVASPQQWMQWQVRSCWLVEAILSAHRGLFAGLPLAARVNRFAMGCFMIGYDLADRDAA
jgi:hypothetical protein